MRSWAEGDGRSAVNKVRHHRSENWLFVGFPHGGQKAVVSFNFTNTSSSPTGEACSSLGSGDAQNQLPQSGGVPDGKEDRATLTAARDSLP
jgi:hypothetical protein